MKRFVLTATVAAFLGACITLAVVLPSNASETAKLRAIADDYRTTFDAGRQELNQARDSLARAQNANRELAKRLADLSNSATASLDLAGKIRIGIYGDLDETRLAHDAIRKALDTVRGVPNASGGAD